MCLNLRLALAAVASIFITPSDFAIGFSPTTHCSSDDSSGEDCDFGAAPHHWYYNHHYDYSRDSDIEEEANELDDDTSWPGKREDFSDVLFR